MERYTSAAVERAMKVQEVILRAMAGKMKWVEAAEVLGIRPRTLRRWKWKMERFGGNGLLDQRRRIPSPRRVPGSEIQKILQLYRDRYRDFNVRHFHEHLREHHGIQRSYTFIKLALHEAGLVRKLRARGRHRQRRERRACFGEMLHVDGSRHHWLKLCPQEWQTLITVVDDATGRLLYGQLWPAESRTAVLTALRTVFRAHGLPQQVYTDRAGWAARTRRAGQRPDDRILTQVQRALAELGVGHIRAFSPQARGRSERLNRTVQGRLVNELRLHGVSSLPEANRYLEECFRPDYDRRFARPAADPAHGFAPLGDDVNLDQYLCVKLERVVNRDNTIVVARRILQLPPQSGRRSCQGLRVTVRHHLDGTSSVTCGLKRLACFDGRGALITPDPGVMKARDRGSALTVERRSRPTRSARASFGRRQSTGQITCQT